MDKSINNWMGVITLTSDFGTKDHYVARIKAALLKYAPESTVVDISNEVDHFNITAAAYLVRSSFLDFPEGSVHLIAINNTLIPINRFIAVLAHKRFFIAPDNGIIPEIVSSEAIDEIRIIEMFDENDRKPKSFLEASENIRSQNGLKRSFKDGIDRSLKYIPHLSHIVRKHEERAF